MAKRQLTDWVDSYAKYYEQLESPVLYRPWVGLSTIASVVGRGIWLPWHSEVYKGFHTYPNLYLMLIAPSGVRKSTSLGPGKNLLETIGAKLAPSTATWQGLIQEWSNEIISDKGSPMTVHCDELSTFLRQESKLSKMHDQLTHIYDNPSVFEYLLISRDMQRIEQPCLNMIGGTTPDGLKRIIPYEQAGEGFLGRFIPLYGHRVEKKVVRAKVENMSDPALLSKLEHDLRQINEMIGEFRWDSAFEDAYGHWYLTENGELDPNDPFNSPLMSSYRQRRPTYIHKLSMLFALSEANTLCLEERHFERAKVMLEQTEIGFAEIFRTYGSDYETAMNDMTLFIAERGEVRLSELYARVMTIQSSSEVKDRIDTLMKAGVIKMKNFIDDPYDRLVVWTGSKGAQDADGTINKSRGEDGTQPGKKTGNG